MSDTDKCPHCGAEIEYFAGIDAYWSTCGSTAKKQSDLCKERAAHAATRKELNSLTDTLDLMRDEFRRIEARIYERGCQETELGDTILGYCKRAMSGITQLVPVISQRDAAESRVRELEGLRVLSRDIGTITLLLDQDLSTVPPLTLGEAMPGNAKL